MSNKCICQNDLEAKYYRFVGSIYSFQLPLCDVCKMNIVEELSKQLHGLIIFQVTKENKIIRVIYPL